MIDTDKLRALDEWLKERIPEEDEFQQFGPINIFRQCQESILAMAEDNKRLKEALERIALSGDGEDVFERSTLYGTFQAIARRALGKDKA